MTAAAKNKKAGIIIASGILLFMFAIGTNALYSIGSVCLDSLPPRCFTSYDSLSEGQRLLLNPGLYVIASIVSIAGALFWFKNPVLESKV